MNDILYKDQPKMTGPAPLIASVSTLFLANLQGLPWNETQSLLGLTLYIYKSQSRELKLEIVNGLDPKANPRLASNSDRWKMLVESWRDARSNLGRPRGPPGELSNASTLASPRPGSQRPRIGPGHLHFIKLFV